MAALRQKQVTCPKCNTVSALDSPKLNLQEVFPVNFYLLGLIYYYSRPSDHSTYDFTPSGFRLQNSTPTVKYEGEIAEFETTARGKFDNHFNSVLI